MGGEWVVQVIKDHMGYYEVFGIYSEFKGKTLEGPRQKSDMI